MKMIENGNFSRWVRISMFLLGLALGYIGFAIDSAPSFLRLLLILGGFVLIAVGGYSSKANTLGLKPFDNSYKKAKESYNESEEGGER